MTLFSGKPFLITVSVFKQIDAIEFNLISLKAKLSEQMSLYRVYQRESLFECLFNDRQQSVYIVVRHFISTVRRDSSVSFYVRCCQAVQVSQFRLNSNPGSLCVSLGCTINTLPCIAISRLSQRHCHRFSNSRYWQIAGRIQDQASLTPFSLSL